jgi:glycosyltransferase involved in cell wall biosynthesis
MRPDSHLPMRSKKAETADVCLFLEGTYPYTTGGVSSWTHELIQMQSHLTFSIVAIVGADAPAKLMYTLPRNVIGIKTVRLQSLREGMASLTPHKEAELFSALEKSLLRLQSRADLKDLATIIRAIIPYRHQIGQQLLLNSHASWNMMLNMYKLTMPKTSFLDYFWSWRGLFGGLFSILLAELPPAKVYHSLCTGYAGLFLARAHIETGRPCVITEHGIYTNERRIEIASADWLDDPNIFSLSINALKQPDVNQDRELKDFWIDTFGNYSRLCYEACSQIITLYEGNQEFQRMDGADPDRMRIIPNGVDTAHYAAIKREPHPPTIALIGRVVPIKDVKGFIKAVHILRQSFPGIRAYMIGPDDEDPQYAAECKELVEHLELKDIFIFTGKVRIEDYLGSIDVVVLSSISEAQPLVILEAGAAGVPSVATDVGACWEMIMGDSHEYPKLGAGGAIVPLSNPRAIANAVLQLITEHDYYRQCSTAIAERVKRYYNKEDQYLAYAGLYQELMKAGSKSMIRSTQKKAA